MHKLDLLQKLNSLNIKIYREGDRLKCDAPQGTLTQELRAEISNQKQDLLDFLSTAAKLDRIQPVSRAQPIPLSFIQQSIWFADQLRGSNATFNIIKHIHFDEPIDPVALNQAFSKLVQRHETLRTCITSVDGRAGQKVLPARPVDVPVVDLTGLSSDDQQTALKREIEQVRSAVFDLTTAPLFRTRLFRLAHDRYWLTVIIHHVVADGWSMNVLSRDIRSLYAACSGAAPLPLPELQIQYADFAAWQCESSKGSTLTNHLAYWKQQLGGSLPELQLPTDYPRPEQQNYQGGTCSLQLSAELTQKLKSLCQKQTATTFMLLMAGFQLLLHRYSGQDDIIVGTPISGRPSIETESLIGPFINSLAIRTKFSEDLTFLQLLDRVKQTTLEAYDHQEAPFERVVQEVKPARSLNRHPIFEVMLNFLNMPIDRPESSRANARADAAPQIDTQRTAKETVQQSKWAHQEAKFSFTLYVGEKAGQLNFSLRYQVALFKPERMAQMLAQFGYLLEQIVDHPEAAIASYSLLTKTAEALLPNPRVPLAKRDYDLVTSRLAHWGQQTPDQAAVAYGDQTWRYGWLEAVTNQLARHLKGSGIQPQDRVVIYAHRSPALVWAVLSILKAGGIFVILDPEYPAERLLDILMATAPQGWIALEASGPIPPALAAAVAAVPCRFSLPQLPPDSGAAAYPGSNEATTPLSTTPQLDDTAYISFTSGSTGKPKGIQATHRPLSHFLDWYSRHLGLDTQARVSLLSGLAHDPLLRDLFAPLWCGATLCIPDAEHSRTPDYLYPWFKESGITLAHITPAMGQLLGLAKDSQSSHLPAVRHIVFGGDALRQEHVRQMRHMMPNAKIINGYGATETPQLMAYFEVKDEAEDGEDYPGRIPLGRGIEGVQILVIRPEGSLAGVGELGEIYVRTPYLSQGYLQNEALTSERFVRNPITRDSQDIVYRTGDLARYLPNGLVEHLGRADSQVKIRGFRVELSEIEARLKAHPSVKAAVVVARGQDSEAKRLVAYVVPKDETYCPSDLTAHLQRYLPGYMVPAAVMPLDAIPMTPNGKVDYQALPADEASNRNTTDAYVAPSTETETALSKMWGELLTLEQVGIQDNFFTLGGHSLLAAQLIARIRNSLEVEVPLRQIFETPTIAGLAGYIEGEQQNGQSQASTIVPANHGGVAPLSFAQQRLWFVAQLEKESSVYNMSRRLRFEGDLDIAAFNQALEALVNRHDSLRTRVKTVGGEPRQEILPPQPVQVPVTDLTALSEDERSQQVRDLIIQEKSRPFDFANETLIRFRLLKLSDREHVFIFVIHHIVSDDWSIGIILQEIPALYKAFLAGQPAPLAALPIQYADFAVWQRSTLQGSAIAGSLAYWTRQLGGSLPALQLPTDYARPIQQDYQGDYCSLTLSPSTTAALRQLSQDNNATLFMVLLASFQLLLSRHTGQDDIIVGTPIAGRPTVETEAVIGIFLNSLALRCDLSGSPSFLALIEQVRRVTLEAYTHQQVPFERVVEEIKPERFLNRHPIFEVMLNYMSAPKSRFELPGVTSKAESLRNIKAKLPITLYVRDREETLSLQLVYQTALFKPERMALFLEQLEALIEQIVTAPEAPISRYSLVTAQTRDQLPDPAIALAEPTYSPVSELIFELGHSQPEHPAVTYAGKQWSYKTLTQRSQAIAQHLRHQELTSGDVVAVSGQRGFGLIASIVAVLSSGGILLTLDPNLPVQRRQTMVAEAKAKYVIQLGDADEETEKAIAGVQRIDVDQQTAAVATANPATDRPATDRPATGHPATNEVSLPTLDPNTPAYIFFTSGTTGKPKGVLGSHRGLAHFLSWQRQQFEIGPADRTAQLTGLSFDVVLRDILLPLTSGATLCLPEPAVALLPARLLPWLEQQRISVLHIVPTLAKNWLANGPAGISLAHLKWLFSAGEPLSADLVNRWRTAFPQSGTIVNFYGPTETTLAKCYFEVPSPPEIGTQPIGDPIPNTQVLILAEEQRLCGIGEVGEITIRTPFRSFGYINAADEQQSRFVANPFRDDADDRIYRTGDLGRYRLDGSLDILGRVDHQIKIRGVRIEPREIETALIKHDQIHEAVVIAQSMKNDEKQIIAYIVPTKSSAEPPSNSELRQYLKGYLVEAMLPSAFVSLTALPLTPNGKIDRRALPEPAQALPSARDISQSDEPRDDLEQQLLGSFKEVLQLQSAGIHDDFFDLGGHSLIAVQLFAKIESLFGRSLPLATLFQATTVAGLAKLIRQENWLAPWHSLVPMQPHGSKPPIFYLHAGGGNLLVYRELMKAMGNDQPVYGLQPKGLDGNFDPFKTIEDMASYYLSLIKKVQPQGPYFLAGLSTGGTIAWEIAQRLRQTGEDVGMLAMFDTSGPDYPKLMPAFPRLLSVMVWSLGDTAESIKRNLIQLLDEPNEDSLKKAKNKVLVKLGLRRKQLSAEQSAHSLNVQNQLNRKVDAVSQISGSKIDKWINLACIKILNRSTKKHYANTFATGMVRHKPKTVPEQLRSLQSSIRQARKRYQLKVYPGKVIFFRASERPPGIVRDPLVGWSGMAKDGFDVYEISGSHEGIMRSAELAHQLKACLDQAQAHYEFKAED